MVCSEAPPRCAIEAGQKKQGAERPSRISPLDGAIGERLRARRKALRLSMGDIATYLGVSHQQVQKYETGRNRIGASRLPVIAKFLGCSVEDLMPTTLVSVESEGADTATCETNRGAALKRALAKPDVVRAVLFFDAIQVPAQRLAALAVLESLGVGGTNVTAPAGIGPAKAR